MTSTTPRSIVLFEESIRSKYTKRNYVTSLRQFTKFVGFDSPEQLLQISHQKLQYSLEDYLLKIKHTTKPNSIPSKFKGIRHFCVMNGIDLNWNIIYKMFPQPQKSQNLRSYTTNEIKSILSCTKNARDKALIHFLASTGARIGVFDHALLVQHMHKMSSKCTAVLLYAGTVEEYWAFLTPQATNVLNAYHCLRKRRGETFVSETPIFTTTKLPTKQLGWSGARSVVYRIVSKCEMRNKHEDRFDVQINHGFRKRYNTILKLNNIVNYNIAEKLMGHKNGLDGIYFTPTLDDLFAEFKKVISMIET